MRVTMAAVLVWIFRVLRCVWIAMAGAVTMRQFIRGVALARAIANQGKAGEANADAAKKAAHSRDVTHPL
jgi:hypothetical protein